MGVRGSFFFNFVMIIFFFLVWKLSFPFSSDEYSLKRASELLMTVARRGEISGFMMPCLFVAAKDDLDSYPMAIKDSAKVFMVVSLCSMFLLKLNVPCVFEKIHKRFYDFLILLSIYAFLIKKIQFMLRYVRVLE